MNQWPGCIGGHVFPSIHLWPIGFSSPWIDMIWCLKLWALVKRNAVAFEVFFGFLKVCEEGGCLGIHFLKDESLEWMIRFLSIFSRKYGSSVGVLGLEFEDYLEKSMQEYAESFISC